MNNALELGVMKFLKNAFDDFSSIIVVAATSRPENRSTMTSSDEKVYAKWVDWLVIGFISVDIGETIFETSFISIELKLLFTSDNSELTSLTFVIWASMSDEALFSVETDSWDDFNFDINEFVRIL